MARNNRFGPGREPFQKHDHGLTLQSTSVQGPFNFLNPTRAHFHHAPSSTKHESSSTMSDRNVKYVWRSRDNRKGRHQLLVDTPEKGKTTTVHVPRRTSHPREVARTVARIFIYYPYWDISWLVAYIFTWGSIVWCINGFFSFLPLVRPSSEFPNEILYGGGITAFIGAVLFFEFGSMLLMFEAVNENSAGCFGWAVEQLIEDKPLDGAAYCLKPSQLHCVHHHQNKSNFVGKSSTTTRSEVKPTEENTKDGRTWQWCLSTKSLREHYLHELGFLASSAQFLGATIFSIAGVTALPGINNRLSQGVLDGIYWVPQVVGGSGFIISGTLYLLETQKNWYTPAFSVLGWHIAAWNLIGGIGFTLCGALGMAYKNSGAEYQASLSTFWGSFAFLIGSVLQLYEALDKFPIDEVRN